MHQQIDKILASLLMKARLKDIAWCEVKNGLVQLPPWCRLWNKV